MLSKSLDASGTRSVQVQKAEGESTQVSEIRHARADSSCGGSRNTLEQVNAGQNRDEHCDPHREDAEQVDLLTWPLPREGQHDAEDCRRCADERGVIRPEQCVRENAAESAPEVEPDESLRPPNMLD